MGYWDELAADVRRRFEKVVRDQDVLNTVAVTELSDGELAHQVVLHAPAVNEAPAPADNAA